MKVLWSRDKALNSHAPVDTPQSSKTAFYSMKKYACNLCGSGDGVHEIGASATLLENCFGFKISNPQFMICNMCTEVISSTSHFKDLVSSALSNENKEPVHTSSVCCSAIHKMKSTKSGDRKKMRRAKKTAVKKDINVKTLQNCSLCQQKYSTVWSPNSDFICARCGILPPKLKCTKTERFINLPGQPGVDLVAAPLYLELTGRNRLRSIHKSPKRSQRQQTGMVSKNKTKEEKQKTVKLDQFTKSVIRNIEKLNKQNMQTFQEPFFCELCNVSLRNKRSYDAHMKVHIDPQTFECKKCGKIFKSTVALIRHQMIHDA